MIAFLEGMLYSILSFVPHMILILTPFKGKMRYSKRVSSIIIAVATLLHLSLGTFVVAYPDTRGTINIISLIVYTITLMIMIKARYGKIAFVLLIVMNVGSLINISAKYLESVIFSSVATHQYGWTYSLMLMLVECAVFVPVYFLIKNYFSNAIRKESQVFAWKYLWLIPATFYFIWYFHVYYHHDSPMDFALDLGHVLFLVVVNMGAFLAYLTVLRLIIEQHKNFKLEEHNSMLNIEAIQYGTLQTKINEARKAKHDMRHHVSAMLGYIDKGEYGKLKEYLNNYRRSIPEDITIEFCKNHAVNMLLLYFAQIAKENNVEYRVKVDIPNELFVKENDLSVLIGNLLENSIHACVYQQKGERVITVGASCDENAMFLTIDNTYSNEIKYDRNGVLISTKEGGTGLGVESVKDIVATYNGTFVQEERDGYFCTSVMLQRQEIENK